MFHVKRMAATALAALMVAGAVPALASADDASGTETPAAQEETVVESGRKPHKRRARSVSSGDALDTGAARTRRKPSKSADSGETSDASGTETPAKPSKKPARKPDKKSADGAETDVNADGETSETEQAAKPARKPAKKAADGTETSDAADTMEKSAKRERPARKSAKTAESASETDAASSATLTI